MDAIIAGVFILLVSLILNWIRLRRKRFSIFKRNGIPGPEPNFWTGNYKDITSKREACISEYVEKYGQIVGFFIGTKPFLIAAEEELIKTVQVEEFNKFGERDSILRDAGIPQPETMLSVAAARGEQWKKKRSLVYPLFTTTRLKKLMPLLNETTKVFMRALEKSSHKEYINILEPIRNVSLDIMIRVALGIDSGVQLLERRKVVDSARLFLLPDTTDILPALSLLFPEFEPIPTKLRYIKDTLKYYLGLPSAKFVYQSIRRVMERRRKNSERREDLLQGLMEEYVQLDPDENGDEENHHLHFGPKQHIGLSDSAIVGTGGILLVAGFDTNSITLSHVIHYLAKYQDIQENVRDEINMCIGMKDDITYEEIFKLSYLDQVLAETLRLQPTSMLTVNRIVSEPFQYKGITIPKGVTVIIPANYLHRNPANWPDPEKFDPQRFSAENKPKVTPFIYQPFGYGPRSCIGMRFAQLAIKLILVRLIRSYYIHKYTDKELEINYAIFIPQPKEVLVRLERIPE